MSSDRLSDLIDLAAVQKMATANYTASGIPIGIIDAVDNSILVGCGWQDICLKFHRANKISLTRCQNSDNHIKKHLTKGEACHYKCENGLWDIGIPIIVRDRHLATLFLGQFFYEGEHPDRFFFIRQAKALGYHIETYLQALDKVPVFKKETVENIVKYNISFSDFIMDLAEAAIQQKEMDKRMQKADEKYHRLAENARDTIYRMSLPDGRYEYVSPASIELLGYKPNEFYDNPLIIKEILHPDWYDYFEKQWNNLLRGKVPPIYEYQVIHKDKTVRWINQRNTLETDDDGSPSAIEGVVTDVTEQKNAEAALFESEARLRILVDTIPDLVWLKDPNGVYLNCNPTFERFFGAKEADIVGKTDYDFVDKDIADFFREHDRKAMGLATSSINEEWLTFSDDGYHGLFETIKTPMYDPNGKLIGVLGIARDITQRKAAEKAIRLNEQRYKSAQKMGLVGNWEYDFVTETFWGSDQAKRIYGFEPASIHFTTDEVENCILERERVHQALIDLIEKNKPYNLEFEIHPISGPKSRIIRSFAELIRDEKGRPLKVTGVIQDITEQKKSEIEKQKLEQQLTQAQKMEAIGRLAGGVAHDFNNMLSIIIGNTEIVLEDLDISSPYVQNLIEVQKAAQRSTDLTRQLLAFARKQTISPESLNLNETIEGMLKLLKRLIGENIHLSWYPEKHLWSVKIDPSQIDQILANLCVNARDAINDVGKVTIETDNVCLDDAYCENHNGFKPGEYVMIAFSDNGIGIDEGVFQRLFEPFFTTKELGKGTGLGLSTVYGIVKQNQGFINVYSEPGLGTTFKIYLPRHKQPSRIKNKPILKEHLKGNETILLVEDEESILKMTKLMLERLGYSVLTASTPPEAIKICSTTDAKIDLLMTDVVMPAMNGRELSEKLSRIYPQMKSLYMSGYTANVIAHHGILDEGLNFINKPFSKQELSIKLRTILSENTN